MMEDCINVKFIIMNEISTRRLTEYTDWIYRLVGKGRRGFVYLSPCIFCCHCNIAMGPYCLTGVIKIHALVTL